MDDKSPTIEPPQWDQQNTPLLGNEDEEFTNGFDRVIASEDLSDSTDDEEMIGPDNGIVKLPECFRCKAWSAAAVMQKSGENCTGMVGFNVCAH